MPGERSHGGCPRNVGVNGTRRPSVLPILCQSSGLTVLPMTAGSGLGGTSRHLGMAPVATYSRNNVRYRKEDAEDRQGMTGICPMLRVKSWKMTCLPANASLNKNARLDPHGHSLRFPIAKIRQDVPRWLYGADHKRPIVCFTRCSTTKGGS